MKMMIMNHSVKYTYNIIIVKISMDPKQLILVGTFFALYGYCILREEI
jgi:hypothetical protein